MLAIKWIVIVILALVVSALVAGQAGLLHGKAPTDLGVQQGKLKAPSLTDNSVSSQADLYINNPQRKTSSIAPIEVQGDGLSTMAKLKGIVEGMDGAKLITTAPDYLHAQYTTSLMKFVDDVEFWFDPAKNVIQVRSASRLGESDLGVNRKRIEAVRAALAAAK
jgi:uncharacterized protein (DUF1499 family)